MKKTMAVFLAVMALAGMLTGCSDAKPKDSAVRAESQAESAAETQPLKPLDASADAAIGKWEMVSLGDFTDESDHGDTEEYRRLTQLELLSNQEARYYKRSMNYCTVGTWEMPDDHTVLLHFKKQDSANGKLEPLDSIDSDSTCDITLNLKDDTLSNNTEYLGMFVMRKTDEFAERSNPEIAAMGGRFVCDAEKSTGVKPAELLTNFGCEIDTLGDSLTMRVDVDKEISYGKDVYIGMSQPDGSIGLSLEVGLSGSYPFEGAAISSEGDSIKLELSGNGEGTLYLKRAES